MLAGRGPVYRSKDTAGGTAGKYHNYCGCSVEETLTNWEPTPREREYANLYNRAAEACDAEGLPRTGKNVTAKMRKLGHGVVNDAHTPETQTGGAGGSGGGRGGGSRLGVAGDDEPKEIRFTHEGSLGEARHLVPSFRSLEHDAAVEESDHGERPRV